MKTGKSSVFRQVDKLSVKIILHTEGETMKGLKIGELLIGKKAILGIVLGVLLTGMIWTTLLFDKDYDLIPVILVINVLIWAIILPKLKKYIKYV